MATALQFDFLMAGIVNNSGDRAAAGLVYFYETDGITFKNIYSDANETIQAANPYTLDARGCAVLFGNGTYSIVAKDSNGVTISNYNGLQYEVSGLSDVISANEFGGFTGTSIALAIAFAAGNDRTVYLSPGNWVINSVLTVPSNINLRFEYGAYLTLNNNVILNGTVDAPYYYIFRVVSGTVTFGAKTTTRPTIWTASPTTNDVNYYGTNTFNDGVNVPLASLSGSTLAGTGVLNLTSGTGGKINITPAASQSIDLDGHWSFDGAVMTALTNLDTVLNAYASKNITIESVTFDGGLVSGSQFTSTVAIGTAPFPATSTTVNTNLNADLLDGQHGTYYLDPSNLSSVVPVTKGGTGESSYTDGQLLIGNSTGNTLTKATLTGTANRITVTNSAGAITLSGPQDLATTSTPTFANLVLSSSGPIVSSITAVGTASLTMTGSGAANIKYAITNGSDIVEFGTGTGSPSFPNSYIGTTTASTFSIMYNGNYQMSFSSLLVYMATSSLTLASGIFTGNGSGLTTLNATNLSSGTVNTSRIAGAYTGITDVGTLASLTVTGDQTVTTGNLTLTAGTFTGNGSGLTTLNATNLSSGTVNTSRIAGAYTGITDVGTLASLTVTGDQTVTTGNLTLTAGTFTGNGSGLTTLNATNLSSGTVNTSRIAGSYTGITAVGTLNQNAFNIAPSSGDTTFTLGQGGSYTAIYYGIGAGTSSGFQLAIYGAQNKQSGSAVDCGYIQFKHEGSSADNKCMMEFWTHNGTSVANRLTLSSNGALTGSSSDASAFDLTWRNTHATGLSRIIVQTDTSAQNAQLVSDIANTRSAVGSSSGGSNWIYFTNSNQIQMISNGTERARLGSDFDLGANKLLFGSAIGTNTANLYASSGDLKTDDSLNVAGDIYTVALTNYSSTSTVSGWSGSPTISIWYKLVGKTLTVYYSITGTSNSPTASFTLPYSVNSSLPVIYQSMVAANDGSDDADSRSQISPGSATVNLQRYTGAAWTPSGTKTCIGLIVCEIA
jgi:hypothetical protein